jgi:CHAT domain-containing protein/tetratricopeptide (TPR) repeat protein
MNEQRIQAYLNLINQLLTCSNGDEPQILSANRELLDMEFLLTIAEVAEQLEANGNQNHADFLTEFLHHFSSQLVETLGISEARTSGNSPPLDYLQFLGEVLQATNDSDVNPQVVYPLLAANLDKLDNNFIHALRIVGAALPEVEPFLKQNIAADISNFSNLIREFSLGNRATNMEISLVGCEICLEVFTRHNHPSNWANVQNSLGATYIMRIRQDRAENLENAIKAYKLALSVYTKKDFPYEWATAQVGLGFAYEDRIDQDRAENLENATKAYELALSVHTKKDFPQDWARIQICLGNAYWERARDDRVENLESATKAYELALSVYTKKDFPQDWAMTQSNLGNAYFYRIRDDRAKNLEKAIEAYQLALSVYTKKGFPYEWAKTQNNLGAAYEERICHDKAENLEKAIEAYQLSLSVYTPEAEPIKCLGTSNNLGNLHFKEGNWQPAIDAYKQAIAAVELSRSWSQDDDRRQEILADAIGVYANTVQCFVNLQQYPQAFEYAERSRSRQLVDLMASKDLYHQGEIPPEVEELLKKFDTLEREIHNLRFPNQSPDKGEMKDAAATTRKRAAWEATNEEVAKKEAEKQQVYRQMRQLDRVLAEQIQVAPLDFARLQQLIEDDTTAILSFYSTNDHTHAFIVRRSGVDLHTCQGQGYRELQKWLYDNWLKPYVTASTSDWHQQMPSKLAEIARRLELDKLVEKLGTPQKPGFSQEPGFSTPSQKPGFSQEPGFSKDSESSGIQELILIPHLYLHQIPFAALPVGEQQYLGDKFLIRTLASCQVLDFCAQRPPLATPAPTYGIVEDTIQDLPCATYEGRQIAQMYQVADSRYLKGSQAKVSEYKKLLPQVQRLLSTHHAQSRLDNNLESALILADGKITLGQLLSPAYRFPNLDEVFLSCCETNLGLTDISDNMMTLNTGFLCAGSRGAVSTLWSVNDLATSLFSIFYHHQRQAGNNRPEALQLAQRQLRQLTGKEFEDEYQQELDKVLTEKLEEASKSLKEAKKQRNTYPKESPEYKEWEEEREKRALFYNRIGEIKNQGLKAAAKKEHPFAELQYWSGFICAGLR